MKRLFILLTLIMSMTATCIVAQNNKEKLDDEARVALSVYVPTDVKFSASTQKKLKNILNQMITKNGMSATKNNRFILTSNIDVVSENIINATTTLYQYTLNVTFYIGDGVDGILFSSTSQQVVGTGETKAAAYNSALGKIKPGNTALQEFITEGKDRIISYYNTQCDFILKEAMAKADRKEYDAALYQLLSIPTVCKDCYDKAQTLSVDVYKRKMENDCQKNIAQAKAEIASNNWDRAIKYLRIYTPDMQCYPQVVSLLQEIQDHRCAEALAKAQAAWAGRNDQEAAYWLADIPTDSKCHAEALKLQNAISSSLDEKEKREWDMKVEREKREWDMREQQQKDATNIRLSEIHAARDIGVAWGENQQPITYNIKTWW